MDHDTVYVVERHDDGYYGPHASRIADGADVAMRVAEAMRDEHRAEDWAMRTSERDDRSCVAFHPRDGASGWVAVVEKPLIRD